MTNYEIFKSIFLDLKHKGKICSPRGEKVLEIENYMYELPPYVRLCNFKSRKLNISYIKKEFLWYLNGDKFDTSITEHAKLWKSLINKDGSINSNYGQYIFKDNFERCAKTLLNDKDSRRASIMILDNNHLNSETKDYPCTYSINFRIRDNKLNMSVRMRSQDAIFGMGNDAPCFSFIHELMYICLRDLKYGNLKLGNYNHVADSFHIYERHFNMLDEILSEKEEDFIIEEIPKINNLKEVKMLIDNDYFNINNNDKFSKWLNK